MIRASIDAAFPTPSRAVGNLPARMEAALALSLEQLAVDLIACVYLTPIERHQVATLVQATLEAFEPPMPTPSPTPERTAATVLRAAIAPLIDLQSELVDVLARHQLQVGALGPLLNELADGQARPELVRTVPAPVNGQPLPRPKDDLARAAQSVIDAIAFLEEALVPPAADGAGPKPAACPAGFRWLLDLARTRPSELAPPRMLAEPDPAQLAPIVRALVHACRTPVPAATTAAHPTTQPDNAADATGPEQPAPAKATNTPAVTAVPQWRALAASLLAPIRCELETPLARPATASPPVTRDAGQPEVLGQSAPVEQEQEQEEPTTTSAPAARSRDDGQAAPVTGQPSPAKEPAPSAMRPATPEAFAAAIRRIHRVVAEANAVAPAILAPKVLADLEIILEMAPHAVPLDVPANLDALRWLYIAAQLYGRPARRPVSQARPRSRCLRCGGELVELPRGGLTCGVCGGLE